MDSTNESPAAVQDRGHAKRLFEAGVASARKGDYLAAATAFEEAQALVAHPTTLLNLGLAYAALGRSVEAVATLTKYLQLTADESTAEHRSAVLSKLTDLSANIGEVRFDPSTQSVALYVDGQQADPSRPLPLNAGWHTASATSVGFHPVTTHFFVSPRHTTSVPLQLTPLPALRITCAAPDFQVLRGGELVGTTDGVTPLTIPRLHATETYVLSRDGYHPQQFAVGENSSTIICAPSPRRRTARLFVTGIAESARIRVDGLPFTNGGALPMGKHRLRVVQPGFHEHEATIKVTDSSFVDLETILRPTKAWHDAYVDHAESIRLVAGVTSMSGVVLALAGAGVLLNNTSRLDDMIRRGETQGATATCADADRLTDTAQSICTWDTYGYLGVGIGTAAALGGAALWWFGPDPDRYGNGSIQVGVDGYRVRVTTQF